MECWRCTLRSCGRRLQNRDKPCAPCFLVNLDAFRVHSEGFDHAENPILRGKFRRTPDRTCLSSGTCGSACRPYVNVPLRQVAPRASVAGMFSFELLEVSAAVTTFLRWTRETAAMRAARRPSDCPSPTSTAGLNTPQEEPTGSPSRSLAACQPDSTASGMPPPGCTVPPARRRCRSPASRCGGRRVASSDSGAPP